MPLTNRNIVRQHNALANAQYSLNAVETDIVMKLIAEIKKEDDDLKEYRFTVTELEGYFGKQLNPRSLKTMAQELRRKNLTIDYEDGGFLVTGWVTNFEYKPKNGEINIMIDPKLKPYLLELQGNYVLTDLRYILRLSSEYAKRIYTIIKSWDLSKEKFEVDVAHWQKILEVPKTQLAYGEFKRKVLEVAKAQINEHTDLFIDYKEDKDGRKVTRLIWTIKAKPTAKQLTIDAVSTDEIDTRLPPEFIKRIVAKCEALMPLSERELTKLIKKEIMFHYQFEADKALVKSIKRGVKIA